MKTPIANTLCIMCSGLMAALVICVMIADKPVTHQKPAVQAVKPVTLHKQAKATFKPKNEHERMKMIGEIWGIKGDKRETRIFEARK